MSDLPITFAQISSKIFVVRGIQVMLAEDLALIYGVETRILNQAVKRNSDRFPEDFRFQITLEEGQNLRSQFVTSSLSEHGGHRYMPYVFTEQGVAMISALLRSQTALRVSIQIMRAFVEMRQFFQNNAQLFDRLNLIEKRQISFESIADKNFEKIFSALEKNSVDPKQGIFYNGQIYDAYIFAGELIRKAKKSLILIDNYIDDSVLTLFTKRASCVSAVFFTKSISKSLALDLKKHNEQYAPIQIHQLNDSHDRFLIIDETEIYHIGASLKDLGKKWFAFSHFEKGAIQMLEKLENIK